MRVGFLGVGHWHAGMHAKGVQEAGAHIVGVWDPDPDAIARFVSANGGEARPDAAAVLHDQPDLIIALGRGPAAAEQLAMLLEHDVPILADKPIGLSLDDVRPLADMAHERHRFVAVALVNRIAGVTESLGDVGRIAHIYFRIINGPPRRYRDWHVPWMLDPQQSGGGALRNLGVHGVDAFLSLAGEQVVRIDHAAFHSIFGEAVEDYACVVLRAANGMVGVIESGYTHPDTGGTYELRINAAGGALVDTGSHLTPTPHRAIPPTGYVPSAQRYSRFVTDTLERVRTGRPPAVSLREFARATDMIDQAYRRMG